MAKSILAGALGGLAASFAMNQFQSAVSAVSEAIARKERERKGEPEPQSQQGSSGEDATTKAAEAISTTLFDRPLGKDEKKWAGPVVHYAFGTLLGTVYGALANCDAVRAGAGTAYGAAVWLAADEAAVPLLGLSGSPSETPVSGHVEALASHLVFGAATHFVRKLILSS